MLSEPSLEQIYKEYEKKVNFRRVVKDAIKLADNHIVYYSQEMRGYVKQHTLPHFVGKF